MADHEQPGYVEDGAQADNDGEKEVKEERKRHYFAVEWKTVGYVVIGAVLIGGGIVAAYFLYKRVRRLEDALSIDEITSATNKLSKRVASLEKALDGARMTQAALSQKVRGVMGSQGALTENVRGVVKNQEALAQRVQANSETIAANAAKASSVDEKLVKTQRFIVDMAQRQKWPWPFNNRIRGLEKEFGLPKH